MSFGYVGYVWAILACSFVVLFLSAVGAMLYVVGKRAERRAPRPVVEAVPIARASAIGAAVAALPTGDAVPPSDELA